MPMSPTNPQFYPVKYSPINGLQYDAEAVWTNVPTMAGGITQLTGDVTAGPGSGSQASLIGTLTHALNLGSHSINNVTDPASAQDAATKNYVDTSITAATAGGPFLPLAGGTMSGVLDMGTNQINNVSDPSGAQDAATKNYVDAQVATKGSFGADRVIQVSDGSGGFTASDLGFTYRTDNGSGQTQLELKQAGTSANFWRSSADNSYFICFKNDDTTQIGYMQIEDGAGVLLVNSQSGGQLAVNNGHVTLTAADLVLDTLGLNANGHVIVNVPDPVNPQDAATKNYVDMHNVSSVALTSQPAAIPTTPLFTPATTGVYRISVYIVDTAAGSAGTVAATIRWTDDEQAQTISTSTVALATLGAYTQSTFFIEVTAGNAITYETTFVGALGSPQYSLYVTAERIA